MDSNLTQRNVYIYTHIHIHIYPIHTHTHYTISGKRPVGKPERRTEKVEEDSRKILGTINWKREAIDRQMLEGYIQEAKARHRAVAKKKKNEN
jgi:hypothetical protein